MCLLIIFLFCVSSFCENEDHAEFQVLLFIDAATWWRARVRKSLLRNNPLNIANKTRNL